MGCCLSPRGEILDDFLRGMVNPLDSGTTEDVRYVTYRTENAEPAYLSAIFTPDGDVYLRDFASFFNGIYHYGGDR